MTLKKPAETNLPVLKPHKREILQIAHQLVVDVSTVSSHCQNRLAKYDVQNTAQLIKRANGNKVI